MPNRVPAVRCTKARHSSLRTSLSSAGVSWRTLMGYSSYARNRTCALPFPSPFHYVMAKIVHAMQLATHAKSGTLYGRSYGRKFKFFRLDDELRRSCKFFYTKMNHTTFITSLILLGPPITFCRESIFVSLMTNLYHMMISI